MIQEELEKNRIELPFEEVEKLFLDGCITKEDFESYLDKDRLFYT